MGTDKLRRAGIPCVRLEAGDYVATARLDGGTAAAAGFSRIELWLTSIDAHERDLSPDMAGTGEEGDDRPG